MELHGQPVNSEQISSSLAFDRLVESLDGAKNGKYLISQHSECMKRMEQMWHHEKPGMRYGCKIPGCFSCERQDAYARKQHLTKIYEQTKETHPRMSLMHLTATIKDVTCTSVKTSLKALLGGARSIATLVRAYAGYGQVEVTPARTAEGTVDGFAHPHLHMAVMVPNKAKVPEEYLEAYWHDSKLLEATGLTPSSVRYEAARDPGAAIWYATKPSKLYQFSQEDYNGLMADLKGKPTRCWIN